MRELLGYVGLVPPPAGRREPVALPAWARWAVPAVIAGLTLLSVLLATLVRMALA